MLGNARVQRNYLQNKHDVKENINSVIERVFSDLRLEHWGYQTDNLSFRKNKKYLLQLKNGNPQLHFAL